MSGATGDPLGAGDRKPAELARPDQFEHHAACEQHVDAAGNDVVERGCRAAIGHVGHLDPGHALEQFACHVRRRAGAGRRVGELALLLLGVGDEFLHRLCRRGVRHAHVEGEAHQQRDRRKIGERVVGERAVERAVDRQRRTPDQHRVAVRVGPRDHLGADIGAGAAFVLDHDLLAPRLGKRIGDDAGDGVGRPARCIRHDDTHESARPLLSRRLCAHGRAIKPGANAETADAPSR